MSLAQNTIDFMKDDEKITLTLLVVSTLFDEEQFLKKYKRHEDCTTLGIIIFMFSALQRLLDHIHSCDIFRDRAVFAKSAVDTVYVSFVLKNYLSISCSFLLFFCKICPFLVGLSFALLVDGRRRRTTCFRRLDCIFN